VVTKDVPDHALMLGSPARIAGWMCECGVRLTVTRQQGTCQECGKRYRVDGDRVELVAGGMEA
jgi:UDP-2-acetamido-3-amino-2,3-dideoxy-glucuronate N-acetyltransferase